MSIDRITYMLNNIFQKNNDKLDVLNNHKLYEII